MRPLNIDRHNRQMCNAVSASGTTQTHTEQVCLPGKYIQQSNSSHTRSGLHLASQPWGSLEGDIPVVLRKRTVIVVFFIVLRCLQMMSSKLSHRHGGSNVRSFVTQWWRVVTRHCHQNNTFTLVALRWHLHIETMFMATYLCNILAFILSQPTYFITQFVFYFQLFSWIVSP